MYAQHHRHAIWNIQQHPYKHNLAEFTFANSAIPGVNNAESALNYILAVLYPNAKAAVNTPADLPATGNTINDYRVVLDDGDGKQAAYRWEQREGDASPQWYKVLDMDWSSDSILAQLLDITQPLYVSKNGRTDIDENGGPITGLYAGQIVYGGDQAGQNLTLNANSGDGVGAQSGFVQIDSQFRPTLDNTYDSGTATEQWRTGYFGTSVLVGTLSLAPALITDSSGQISFDDENLVTTGNITGNIVTGSQLVADDTTNQLTIVPGSITDTTGAISFGDENLSTTGTLSAASGSSLGDLTFTDGQIVSASGAISFNDENLSTTGTLSAGDTTVTRLDVDNIRLDNNLISVTNLNGNLELQANGSGVVDVQNTMNTLSQVVTGTVSITGQLNADNIRIDGNTIFSTNLNGNVILSPNGTGQVLATASILPNSDNTLDLGATGSKYRTLYLGTGISDGSNSYNVTELLTLRSATFRDAARTQVAQPGDTIFWNGTQFLASEPDTEIDHGEISGLADDDHVQYMLLAGRAGGQNLVGGTAASENLTLESTSDTTKGRVLTKDTLSPFTDATFSGGWQGIDLGGSGNYYRDIYTKGELRGARMENFTSGTLPASSGQNVGRFVWATDVNKAYIDTGSQFKVLGVSKFVEDTNWNGTDTTKDVDVSSNIQDARLAIWALHDNANDFERIYTNIRAISATTVRITVSPALPAGSYRLIGIE